MKKGSQYVQIDLGGDYSIYAIVLWHDHRYLQIFHDVIVQVADERSHKNVRTLSIMTRNNSSGLVSAQTASILRPLRPAD